jgi:lauroyl/myristoyl acyltransferase
MGVLFRLAERLLPIALLAWAILPVAALAGRRMVLRKVSLRRIERLPAVLRRRWPRGWWRRRWRVWRGQMAVYTTRFLCFIPERLRRPQWQRRCRFVGLPRLEAALAGGRPVILATLHYGDLVMLYHWLRSRGIAVAFMAARKRKATPAFRDRLDQLADRADRLEGVPRLIHPDQLWDAREHLEKPGRVLVLAMERNTHYDIQVTGPGYSLRVTAGGLRLAAIVGAVVIPCLISSHRWLASTIRFGRVVPVADIADHRRHGLACERIVRQLVPWAARRPEQCTDALLSSLCPPGESTPNEPALPRPTRPP